MQFFLIEIEIKISLLTKSGPQLLIVIQITIMIDTQQQYIELIDRACTTIKIHIS
jgi:hypothetical protein